MNKNLYIGDIPINWNTKRLKYFVSIKTGKKDAGEGSVEGKYPFFTCSVEPKYIDSYSYDTEALLIAGNGCVGNTQYYIGKFDAYQRTYILDNFKGIDPMFIKYYCFGLLIKSLEHSKIGSVIDFIKLGDIQNFIIAYPDIQTQKCIASYLDKKIYIIDSQIEKNKKSIGLLDEYRTSLIDKAVSPQKGWKVEKLRFLGQLQNGVSAGAERFDKGYPFVNYTDVYNNIILPNKFHGTFDSTDSERTNYSVKKGDVFFTRTSETIEEVGISSVCMRDIENATFSGFLIRFRPSTNELNPQYSKYYFRSNQHRSYFAREMNIISRASLGQNLLKNMKVVIPSEEEQQEIAKYLDNKCYLIDKVIDYRKQIIEKLEEYRKSLIYEVVTGKIEV